MFFFFLLLLLWLVAFNTDPRGDVSYTNSQPWATTHPITNQRVAGSPAALIRVFSYPAGQLGQRCREPDSGSYMRLSFP